MENSKAAKIVGLSLKYLLVAFFLVDGGMKIAKAQPSIEGSTKLGIPIEAVQPLGIALFIFTILYSIPKTTSVGLALITAYLGGAAAAMVISMKGGHGYLFPVVICILTWVACYLTNINVRKFLFDKE